MPAIRNSTLKADHTHIDGAGVLSISGSLGQLLVYVTCLSTTPAFDGTIPSPASRGRSVPAAHAVHQKNAVSARRCAASGTVSFFIAYASRSVAVAGSLPNRLS